ncbi:HDIG domain-containing metalloprotein [Megalodesulfovibrio gigas]|uniref:Putative metal-dependent phosphohydrolase n=1 Tax=Megalodesulfovibrio gigas (strain ATCC 19364 / DSM 1382 / NCIMB 9332 / VKM B-1759) TaxID=1121448 RepID=T2G9S3_MEGG1|nr:HDIG domain-containing metalloprotein [Megalodesulfovibrio gigas]AGW12642.1 putative metal-dependent phosphohydrolase [Megalodesulfovibrio gigas DSM 1382 = ATCC 19364]
MGVALTLPAPPVAEGVARTLGVFVPDFPVPDFPVPDDARCLALWDAYAVPEHIREHSLLVARIATAVAQAACEAGFPVPVQEVRASALLHDLAKAYTIRHTGSHAQLGAAWVLAETGNPRIAQGVAHHVWWPWPVDVRRHFLPMAVIYGDKRVAHDRIVTLDERYHDLMDRYGTSPKNIAGIERTQTQVLEISRAFTQLLGCDPDACAFDSGRLVQRA